MNLPQSFSGNQSNQVLIVKSSLSLIPTFFRVRQHSGLYLRGPWQFQTMLCIFLGRIFQFGGIYLWAGGSLRPLALSRNFLLKTCCLKVYAMLDVCMVFASINEKGSGSSWKAKFDIQAPLSRFSEAQSLNLRAQCSRDSNIKIGLYVGRDHPHKRLESLPQFVDEAMVQRYLFVGSGEFIEVKRAAAANGVPYAELTEQSIEHILQALIETNSKKIFFVGQRNTTELSELYITASHYLSVSRSEGMSNSVVDAIHFGLTVIMLPDNGFDQSDSQSKIFGGEMGTRWGS